MEHPSLGLTRPLGAAGDLPQFQQVNPSKDWLQWLVNFIYQHCVDGDTWGCTNFSLRDAVAILAKFLYRVDLDISVSFSAVDSGTVAGQGNSLAAADASLINHWSCADKDKPFVPNVTTLAQFFAPNTAEQKAIAALAKQGWELRTSYLSNFQEISTPAQILEGLGISPVRAVVDGHYNWDAEGRVTNNPNFVGNHVVVIIGQRPQDGSWLVFDSENTVIEYFAPDYKFYECKVYSLKKKRMQTYKLNGGPILLALCADGFYRPVKNGAIYHYLFGAYSTVSGQIQTTNSKAANYVNPIQVVLNQVISIDPVTPGVSEADFTSN